MLNNNTRTVENQAVSLDNNTRTVEDQAVSLDNNMATVLGQNDSLECDLDTLPDQAGLLEDKNFCQKILDKFKNFCQKLESKERYQFEVTKSIRTSTPNFYICIVIANQICFNIAMMYFPVRYTIQNFPEGISALYLVVLYLLLFNLGVINIIRQLIDSCKEIENDNLENDDRYNDESPPV